MELLGLLAIGIVIGIPTIAIIALVRSRAAERRIEESWYKISDLQGDIAGLRREVVGLSDRVNKLEAAAAVPRAEDRKEHRAPEPAAASAVREEVKVAPQPAAASSWPAAAAVPLSSATAVRLWLCAGFISAPRLQISAPCYPNSRSLHSTDPVHSANAAPCMSSRVALQLIRPTLA
jgi:hypothetical protein